MKHFLSLLIILSICFSEAHLVKAQIASQDSSKLKVQLQYRPRTEFRDGYRAPAHDSSKIASSTTHRLRLNIGYELNKVELYTSIQNTGIWGEAYGAQAFRLFEAWANIPLNETWNLKAGRQIVNLDNGRLMNERNWSQTGYSIDALRLNYSKPKFKNTIVAAFNQKDELVFGSNYIYNVTNNFKYLFILFSEYSFKNFKITSFQTIDGFEMASGAEIFRHTNGGRLTWTKNDFTATAHAYYQHGKTPQDKIVKSWYANPEITYKTKNEINIQTGCELISGNTWRSNREIDRNFVPLYGVGHRFLGFMDYFVKFPDDTKDLGLVSPYLMLKKQLKKSYSINTSFHTFFSHHSPYILNEKQSNYLGFEHDITLSKKINNFTNIEIGYSYMLPTSSMFIVKNAADSKKFQQWAYVMINISPTIFNK